MADIDRETIVSHNAEFNHLMKEMDLTPGMLATLSATSRSTLHGYVNNNINAPALSLAFMRLLHFMYVNNRQQFLDYLVLSEMENVQQGTQDPRIALIYRQGKLRKPIREYIMRHQEDDGKHSR